MDCSPPGSSVHRIFQARILEWDSPGDIPNLGLLYCREILHHQSHQGCPHFIYNQYKLLMEVFTFRYKVLQCEFSTYSTSYF